MKLKDLFIPGCLKPLQEVEGYVVSWSVPYRCEVTYSLYSQRKHKIFLCQQDAEGFKFALQEAFELLQIDKKIFPINVERLK